MAKLVYFSYVKLCGNMRTMAITPICDKCGRELTAFGAILFSPPNEKSEVKKFHICVDCYNAIASELTQPTL